jgi:small ligand-binding sensory domain FIST
VAAARVVDALDRELAGAHADLVLFFFGPAHVAAAGELAQVLRDRLEPGCLMGASAHAVISSRHEVESAGSLSAIAATLPGVDIRPFVMVNAAWVAAAEDAAEFARSTPNVSDASPWRGPTAGASASTRCRR